MKKLISNFTFDPVQRTLTFNDYATVDLERLLLVTNVTDNVIIYNFADPTRGGGVAGNVVTLLFDTTSMSSNDALQIFYEDAAVPATEATIDALLQLTGYLKLLINQTKTLATQDTFNRQRVVVDTITMPTTVVTGTVIATHSYGDLVMRQESSRSQFATGIRSNLVF